MKRILTILLLFVGLNAFADNPERQYCGLCQYGFIQGNDLYTSPNGQGWKFPRPLYSMWVISPNCTNPQTYYLKCNDQVPTEQLPLDASVYALFIGLGIYSFKKLTT